MGKKRCAGATPKGCGVWRGRMGELARDLEPCVLGPNFSHHKVALVLSALRSLIVREGWWESCCHRPSPQAKGFGCYEASRIVPGTRWTPNKHWLALFQPAELFIMKGHGQRVCHERPKHRKLSLPSQVEQTLEIRNAPKIFVHIDTVFSVENSTARNYDSCTKSYLNFVELPLTNT